MRGAFGDAGYLLRESLLDEQECAELRAVAERVAVLVSARAERSGAGPVAELADGHRIQFSSRTAIQWEWAEGSREIRLLEPVEHLDERFATLFGDDRLVAPVRRELGGAVAPFTSKLNFKRAAQGSEFPWHQDYPYWYVAVGTDAQDVVTAIVFLDDATVDNGALRVIPGSHLNGPARRNPSDPTRFLTDPSAIDTADAVVIEAPAGTVIWFGAFLVHCSTPNRTTGHRRALLPSWQPAGRSRFHDFPYRPERVTDLP
jgi:ectoine hydroxylase